MTKGAWAKAPSEKVGHGSGGSMSACALARGLRLDLSATPPRNYFHPHTLTHLLTHSLSFFVTSTLALASPPPSQS